MDSNFLLPSAVALRRPPSELGEGTWLLWLAGLLTIKSPYPLSTTFSCSNYQQSIHRKKTPFSGRPQNLERFVFCCSRYSKHGRGPAVRASAGYGAIPVIIHWLLLLFGLYADRLVCAGGIASIVFTVDFSVRTLMLYVNSCLYFMQLTDCTFVF